MIFEFWKNHFKLTQDADIKPLLTFIFLNSNGNLVFIAGYLCIMIWKPGMLVHSPSRASKIRQPNATNSATTAKQDMSSSNVVIENEVHNNKYTKPTSTTKTANNSASLTIFLLINSMIGSGILNQPYVFMKSGLLGALFGYMIVILGTWSGLFLLTEAGIISNNFDFSSLARESLGVEGEQLVDGSIM